jgi:type I restriction enzyme S subunit
MASEWTESSLGQFVEIRHGFAFQGEFFRNDPPGDILLTPGNFAIGGGFKADKLKYYAGPVPDEFVLHEGDLLVTMTDLSKATDTLGFPAWVPSPPSDGGRFLHNQRLGKVSVKPGAPLEREFLYYLLCCQEYRNEVVASATGSTVKHTSPNRIKNFEFRCPPRHEQLAIAQILGVLDDKIHLNQRVNKVLEDMARTIFNAWFVDFEPVRAKAGGHTTFRGMQQSVFDQLPAQFTASAIGSIPVGWEYVPIGNLVEVVGGSTPSTNNPGFWEGGEYAFCTPKDMSALTSSVLLDTERHITQLGVDQISSGQLPVGTVLLSSRAPIGYLAIAQTRVSVNQGIIAMRTGDIPNTYILLWTESNMEAIKARAGGTTFAEISKGHFRPILALRPDAQTLAGFGDLTCPLFEVITANQRESRVLTDIRDSLLPKLISGKIRVPGREGVHDGQ